MTPNARRPGGHAPVRLDEPLAAVHQLVAPIVELARREHGPLPGVGTAAWSSAPTFVRLAAVLVLGEAWLVHDPERAVRQRLREMSWDLSDGADWHAVARRPSFAELQRRRGAVA